MPPPAPPRRPRAAAGRGWYSSRSGPRARPVRGVVFATMSPMFRVPSSRVRRFAGSPAAARTLELSNFRTLQPLPERRHDPRVGVPHEDGAVVVRFQGFGDDSARGGGEARDNQVEVEAAF